MAIPVEMPKMSDTMEEGVLVAWLVEEGAEVSAGDIIAQVETDKATMDLETYDDGVLLKRVIDEGAAVPIGALIAVLGSKDEDISDILAKYSDAGSPSTDNGASTSASEERVEEPAPMPSAGGDGSPQPSMVTTSVRGGDGRLKSSPLARRLAQEHGIDIAMISGSGPEGRVIKRDIEAVIEAPASTVAAPAAAQQSTQQVKQPVARPVAQPVVLEAKQEKISQMRKAISRRLAESKFTAPHFYLTVDVDMANSIDYRQRLNDRQEKLGHAKISFNDLITKASAFALREHPAVNGSYDAEAGVIRYHGDVNVAVAVAFDEGLITPVIRNADAKGLSAIAAETRELATRARDRQLQPHEYEGSTFTTSNLGMFGIEEFTAIINPPNSCILAIGAIRDEPVVEDGAVVPGKRMKLTLSCDHRLVDGATGAKFLTSLKDYLEEPLTMLL